MTDPTDLSYPTVVPMIAYEDAGAAADWLCRAFGFRERREQRYTDDDGTVSHAELEAGDDGVLMLATPSKDYRITDPSPRTER